MDPGAKPLADAALDPGIRDVVYRLNAAGFETTDSGDGRSKEPSADVMTYPHVAIASSPTLLVADARRALKVLLEAGFGDGLKVEASFDPADNSAIILAMWLSPELLAGE